MTAVNVESYENLAEQNNQRYAEIALAKLASIASFVVDRFVQNGEYQLGKDTTTPTYFHESYPNFGTLKIVLGEE